MSGHVWRYWYHVWSTARGTIRRVLSLLSAPRERQETFFRNKVRIDRFHFTVVPFVATATQTRLAVNIDHIRQNPAHPGGFDLLHEIRVAFRVDDLWREDDQQ